MRRITGDKLSDEDIDRMVDELSEKDILWGIYEEAIEANRHLRVVATAAAIAIVLGALAVIGAVASVAS